MTAALRRIADVVVASVGLVLTLPVMLVAAMCIWLEDRHPPIYRAPRVGKGGMLFRMVKLRSMTPSPEPRGPSSTSANDPRLTRAGKVVRRWKIDELPQLWNVLAGDMSLVGPRPNVPTEVLLYSEVEMRLLSVRPGITDLSSIVFADEGEIFRFSEDPDRDYQLLVRPWKSQLGLLYLDRRSLRLDAVLVAMTMLNIVSRRTALACASRVAARLGAPPELRRVARRSDPLTPVAALGVPSRAPDPTG